jgi:hypothetical protein
MLLPQPLSPDLLRRIDAYWRAANYLAVGQIYLADNPLLRRPLAAMDVKHMLLGHWGTTPGQNFIYAHLNRVIKQYDLDISRAPTARSTPPSARMRPGCRGSSSSSPFPAAFPATPPRIARARSTKAASWAIRSAMPSGRCSTIRP